MLEYINMFAKTYCILCAVLFMSMALFNYDHIKKMSLFQLGILYVTSPLLFLREIWENAKDLR